ncbi:hypothetical protein M422DRAFT_229492 [Sphaerobolus stellatus SS14]|uniref:non-specific serine/threonine protein kinase n=1 Tax=Sphaerobolus stellatus (strain SS14) TaxID=990650 RepID=A0A0C9VK31_SPHS4|nr:hypothetical protein M422DRAFT_229492 [Sphaerobolus stellatus SS14]
MSAMCVPVVPNYGNVSDSFAIAEADLPTLSAGDLAYIVGPILGSGGFSHVFQAEDLISKEEVALKKSRVSQRVSRTFLCHESRVLQLLQGHPAIPVLYGYGQLPHFDYMAMELLGPSVKQHATGRLPVRTVVRVVQQTLSALEHVHRRGFVHRDIKPENLLCCKNDLSKIMLIDFGISKRFKPELSKASDNPKKSNHVVGTLHWASLNAHRGIDLSPRDDLESLAYTALFLLRSNLPWRHHSHSVREHPEQSKAHVEESKASSSGAQLAAGYPLEFGYLLDYSRALEYDQIPDYFDLSARFSRLVESLGGYAPGEPLDWSSGGDVVESVTVGEADGNEESTESKNGDTEHSHLSTSYFGSDHGDYDGQNCPRDRSLTLPTELMEEADSLISRIVEIFE